MTDSQRTESEQNMAEIGKKIEMEVDVKVDTEAITQQVQDAMRLPMVEMARVLIDAAYSFDRESFERFRKAAYEEGYQKGYVDGMKEREAAS